MASISSCSRQADPVQGAREVRDAPDSAVQSSPATQISPEPSLPEEFEHPAATASPVTAVAESAASLERKYLEAQEPTAREEILEELRDMDNAEAVQAFGHLFEGSTDEKTKLDLLATLDQMDCGIGKLAILVTAVRTDQPAEVRAAAIDTLSEMSDPAARQLLQTLTQDSDPAIREAALDAIEPADSPP